MFSQSRHRDILQRLFLMPFTLQGHCFREWSLLGNETVEGQFLDFDCTTDDKMTNKKFHVTHKRWKHRSHPPNPHPLPRLLTSQVKRKCNIWNRFPFRSDWICSGPLGWSGVLIFLASLCKYFLYQEKRLNIFNCFWDPFFSCHILSLPGGKHQFFFHRRQMFKEVLCFSLDNALFQSHYFSVLWFIMWRANIWPLSLCWQQRASPAWRYVKSWSIVIKRNIVFSLLFEVACKSNGSSQWKPCI